MQLKLHLFWSNFCWTFFSLCSNWMYLNTIYWNTKRFIQVIYLLFYCVFIDWIENQNSKTANAPKHLMAQQMLVHKHKSINLIVWKWSQIGLSHRNICTTCNSNKCLSQAICMYHLCLRQHTNVTICLQTKRVEAVFLLRLNRLLKRTKSYRIGAASVHGSSQSLIHSFFLIIWNHFIMQYEFERPQHMKMGKKCHWIRIALICTIGRSIWIPISINRMWVFPPKFLIAKKIIHRKWRCANIRPYKIKPFEASKAKNRSAIYTLRGSCGSHHHQYNHRTIIAQSHS